MNTAKVLGVVGWSGSGKTTLITKLIPVMSGRGLRVATLKHAHHAFDVDQPGKDSYEHRKARRLRSDSVIFAAMGADA